MLINHCLQLGNPVSSEVSSNNKRLAIDNNFLYASTRSVIVGAVMVLDMVQEIAQLRARLKALQY
ncbi:MAG: hypothetical protein V7K38_21870 [Nostoc sp.]|uniref:hypothetical protein n=1 Tax=Nostoc sp. TaxID=1180 RepID=UPI002FF6CFDF